MEERREEGGGNGEGEERRGRIDRRAEEREGRRDWERKKRDGG